MNEVNIQKFLQQTADYLQANKEDLSKEEMDSVIELYDDLSFELDRQQDQYDLYNEAAVLRKLPNIFKLSKIYKEIVIASLVSVNGASLHPG